MKTSNKDSALTKLLPPKHKPTPRDCLVEVKSNPVTFPRASRNEAINIIYNLLSLLPLGGLDLLEQALHDRGFTEIVIPLQSLHPTIEFTYEKWEGILTVTPLSEVVKYGSDELTPISPMEFDGMYLYHTLIRETNDDGIDIRPYREYYNDVTAHGRNSLGITFKEWKEKKATKPTEVGDIVASDILATLALVVNKTLPLDVAMGALSKKYPENGKRIATHLLYVLSSGQLDEEI